MSYADSILKATIDFLSVEAASPRPFLGFQGLPLKAADGVYYKGSNVAILMAAMNALGARDQLPAFTGMTGWQKLGRRVRKGGKASYGVLLAGYFPVKDKNEEDKKEKQELIAPSKLQDYDGDQRLLPSFKTIKTFHISQTELKEGWDDKAAEFAPKQSKLTGFELERFILKVKNTAELLIEEWHQNYQKATPMQNGERQFICRFAIDLALAHRLGRFAPEEAEAILGAYDPVVVLWLNVIRPRTLMRSCNLAYKALLEINPELKEAEANLEEMQQATEKLREFKQHQAEQALLETQEQPVQVTGARW